MDTQNKLTINSNTKNPIFDFYIKSYIDYNIKPKSEAEAKLLKDIYNNINNNYYCNVIFDKIETYTNGIINIFDVIDDYALETINPGDNDYKLSVMNCDYENKRTITAVNVFSKISIKALHQLIDSLNERSEYVKFHYMVRGGKPVYERICVKLNEDVDLSKIPNNKNDLKLKHIIEKRLFDRNLIQKEISKISEEFIKSAPNFREIIIKEIEERIKQGTSAKDMHINLLGIKDNIFINKCLVDFAQKKKIAISEEFFKEQIIKPLQELDDKVTIFYKRYERALYLVVELNEDDFMESINKFNDEFNSL